MTQTVIIRGKSQREFAHSLVEAAPINATVRVSAAKRTIPQNDRMWAMISDVSRAKPEGRCHAPEVWKCLFMNACGHKVRFELGLDGEPFPIGFRSSHLTVEQMTDLIEFIYWYGSQHGVLWTERDRAAS